MKYFLQNTLLGPYIRSLKGARPRDLNTLFWHACFIILLPKNENEPQMQALIALLKESPHITPPLPQNMEPIAPLYSTFQSRDWPERWKLFVELLQKHHS